MLIAMVGVLIIAIIIAIIGITGLVRSADEDTTQTVVPREDFILPPGAILCGWCDNCGEVHFTWDDDFFDDHHHHHDGCCHNGHDSIDDCCDDVDCADCYCCTDYDDCYNCESEE